MLRANSISTLTTTILAPLLLLLLSSPPSAAAALAFPHPSPSTTVTTTNDSPVNCFAPPILAPEADCRAVLKDMLTHYSAHGADPLRSWGRRYPTSNATHVSLPHGFQLTRTHPRPLGKRCEIHVDNRIQNLDDVDSFIVMDVLSAARAVLAECYPSRLTGWAYPSGRRIIYVTTIYMPYFEEVEGEQGEGNVTILGSEDVGKSVTVLGSEDGEDRPMATGWDQFDITAA